MHATYIILQLKSLVSVLVHLCHMLLEVGNWYRHPDLWHWERHVIIKLSPLHAEELYTYCTGVLPVLVFLIGFSVCRCSQFHLNAFTTGGIHCAPCAFVVGFDIWLGVDTARWYLALSSYPVQQCRIQSYKELSRTTAETMIRKVEICVPQTFISAITQSKNFNEVEDLK